MNVPERFDRSWSAPIPPGRGCKVALPSGVQLCLTALALDQKGLPKEGRVAVYLSVKGSQPVAVASFIVGRSESVNIDVRFNQGDQITFLTKGSPIPVLVFGVLSGKAQVAVSSG
jgi:hypothetical protein